MFRLVFLSLALSLVGLRTVQAQCVFGAGNCTSSMSNGTSANFNALTWTFVSGSACPTGASTSYNGNLEVDMANNTNLTISSDFTVNGDFKITNSGSSETLIVPDGVTLHVTGNLGDCTNNNANFHVDGVLIVDGYIVGKNSNGFSGNGSITATGGLYFNMAPSCSPCNITWNVGSCEPAGSGFCTLPIELVGFDAVVKASGVQLHWITETEIDVDYFTIERSRTGSDFAAVGTVPGHGTSTLRHEYDLVDEHPFMGLGYYRLIETDLFGRSVAHRIIHVKTEETQSVELYPVPVTKGVLNLRLGFQSMQTSRAVISDVMGVALCEAVFSGDNVAIPIDLRPGIYFLTFVSGDYRAVIRFVVN